MIRFKLIFTLLAILLSGINSISQWQSDVRLTNDPDSSGTSNNNAWCIATSGNIVHVVWYDNRDGNTEIYYKRSTDEGNNWGADTRLTNAANSSYYPSVAVSGSAVHVIWSDARDGNTEIYYKRSTDGGVSWGTDIRLTNDPALSYFPSVSVSGSVIHIVWYDSRDGNIEIYYKRSTDGGNNWLTDTRLTNDPAFSGYPSASVSGSVVHVVWQDLRDGNYEIYYKRSTDGGNNWGADTRLTNNTVSSNYTSVSVSGQIVHVVWGENPGGNFEIYYKRSTDGGTNWEANIRLTNAVNSSIKPSVAVSGQVVHVAWNDQRDGNPEIYYKRSTDGGTNWEADTRLTNNSAFSFFPSVAVSAQVVHVIWNDQRDGNMEIYYKRNPTGNVVGITNINSEIPDQFSLSQNYPNPFNPSTVIRCSLPVAGMVTLKIYDVLGREVETLVNEELKAGTYEVDWDGSDFASGIYYYTLQTNEFSETRKAVLIK